MKNLKPHKLLRPNQHVEKVLVRAILDGTYASGAVLPNERGLAEQLGVTRQTLREILQRLAGEGWITIQHGKPTVVNDYWRKGGLRLLGTLSKYSDHIPNGFVTHLLEVRLAMLPRVAGRAAILQPEILLGYLSGAQNLSEDAGDFSDFDWKLQMLMARHSQNPLFSMILNDFGHIFNHMARHYFQLDTARRASLIFYQELARAIENHVHTVEDVVKKAMEQSILIWEGVNYERRPLAKGQPD
jgi:GntR family negative regulator for fad regulon and positive regulator of fabA